MCSAGGWAAFDINNDQDWLNYSPLQRPQSHDRPQHCDSSCFEMVGRCNLSIDSVLKHALGYLRRKKTLAAGLVVGGNYIYGTSSVLTALSLLPLRLINSVLNRVLLGLLDARI